MNKSLQECFFSEMADPQGIRCLFDRLPDVSFFMKDTDGRFIAASRCVLENLGLKSEAEIVGRTDDDFYTKELANRFREDDRKVVQTGGPVINRVEVCIKGQKLLDWFITSKLPVTGKNGTVIGVMGLTMSVERAAQRSPAYRELGGVVEYIREHFCERITVSQLADIAAMSVRQFHRRFHDIYGSSPYEFLQRVRVQAASATLMQTDRSVSQIAMDFGFYDQSNFTKTFSPTDGRNPGPVPSKIIEYVMLYETVQL